MRIGLEFSAAPPGDCMCNHLSCILIEDCVCEFLLDFVSVRVADDTRAYELTTAITNNHRNC